MFEIEKMEKEFDYSLVDNETADFLRSCEYEINGIAEDARIQFGRVLKKAQEKLAKYGSGVFSKWYESGGLDRNDVYYAINLFDSSRNLEERQKKNFLNAPKTLQKEVMKKKAPVEAKQAVLEGDIKTLKEYKELVKKLEEAEQAKRELEESNNKLKREKEKLDQLLTEERNKPQESVTVEVEKVIDNTDYDTIKRLRSEIDELTELKKDYQNKYTNTLDSLSEAQNKIKLVVGENTEFTLVKDTTKNLNRIRELTLILLEYECNSDAFNNLPDATRREYVRAFNSIHKASSRLLGQVRTDDVIELSDNVVNLINYKEEK